MSDCSLLNRSLALQREALEELRHVLEVSEPAESRPPEGPRDSTPARHCGPRAPGSKRPAVRTIAQRAHDSILSRLVQNLSQLLSVEEDLCSTDHCSRRLSLRLKDSVELKNISMRMTSRGPDSQCPGDLRELRECLKVIVLSLISSQNDHNHKLCPVSGKLGHIITTFPDF
ncbi:leukemia-associated protein 7 [Arapaima gigas]